MSNNKTSPEKISSFTPQDPSGGMTMVTIKMEQDTEDVFSMADQTDHNSHEDYTNGLHEEVDIKEQIDTMDDEEYTSPDLNTVKLEVEEHSLPDELISDTEECQMFEPCTRKMLPRIHMFGIMQYFMQNNVLYQQLDYNKLKNYNDDDLYEDDTIGHVHINKLEDCIALQCTVAFTRTTSYTCFIKYNVNTKSVECTKCECQKAACEHIITFLMWWHRRSEERIDNNMAFSLEPMMQEKSFIKARDLALDNDTDSASESGDCDANAPIKGDIIQEFLIKCVQKKQFNSPLYRFMCNDEITQLSMHRLACDFVKEGASGGAKPDQFLAFCSRRLEQSAPALARLAAAAHCDVTQEMRYARIHGEHFLMAADELQDIVDEIMFPDLYVEDKTIEQMRTILEKKLSTKIKRTGLYISKDNPIFCASPYGVTDTHVVDITYVKDGQKLEDFLVDGSLTDHIKARLQLYMYVTNKTNSTFYLGYKDDNNMKQIQIHKYPYNSSYCENLLKSATEFWKSHVYLKLLL